MNATTYLWIAFAVTLGAFVQGSVGFGFGIFAIPIMVSAGIAVEHAVATLVAVVVIQSSFASYRNRAEIPWRHVLHISVYRFITLPLGVSLLFALTHRLPHDRIRQFVGAVLLSVICLQICIKPTPREKLNPFWAVLAGCLSGTVAGLVGMGGPPIVLWSMAHNWTALRGRVFLWTVFLIMAPWQLFMICWRFGDEILMYAGLGLLYAPLVILGNVIGEKVGVRLSRERLRFAAYAILILIGASSLLAPLL